MSLIHGDCLEVMAGMDAESVDAVVCDPPYGLEFMGKEWDRLGGAGFHAPKDEGRTFTNASGHMYDNLKSLPRYGPAAGAQAWHQQWAEAAYRVAKPSAYLLAFGGTRTVHRMTVALEDAGWIIRDMLVWAYASGFPKSKASLKPAWEPIVMARKPGPLRDLAIDACRIPGAPPSVPQPSFGSPTGRVYGMQTGEGRNGEMSEAPGRWPANVILTDPIFDGGVEGVVGGGETNRAWTAPSSGRYDASGYHLTPPEGEHGPLYGDSGTYSRFFLIPKADRADREPVLGGLPERRIVRERLNVGVTEQGEHEEFVHPVPDAIGGWLREQRMAAGLTQRQVAEHFPSRTGGLTGCVLNWESEYNRPTPDQWRTLRSVIGFDGRYDDVMTQTRLVSNALSGDQPKSGRRNVHPTVKPTDLMRHLVRLVTPTGGTVLDPFLGSGSTGLACELEGFPWIGIEREAEYVAIAEARLNGTQRGLGLGA